MTLNFTKKAEKGYQDLPAKVQRKADKQFNLLIENYRHPSLRTRKMGGSNKFEGRIDIHYRFTFKPGGEEIHVLTVGSHDVGLGKK
ncbi:hypothetical protein HYZ78_00310 [Candidatus Microgenomates bacterium]|nr:hypothetical protein [Candidatus Microgenomates bacterium]